VMIGAQIKKDELKNSSNVLLKNDKIF
jgi:hypothetical protein